jgi:hypothetical protein
MNYEFEKDSKELDEFVKSLSYITSEDYEGDLDDFHTFQSIYFRKSDGKYYKAEMKSRGGVYGKSEFQYYHRNFKTNEPFVVNFYEVVPVEVVVTKWEEVGVIE